MEQEERASLKLSRFFIVKLVYNLATVIIMPKIRWSDGTSFYISTDDLALPGFISLLLRAVSVVLFVMAEKDIRDCNRMFRWWVDAAVVVTGISIIHLAAMVIISSRGGVFEAEKRAPAVSLMRLRVCVFFPIEMLLAAYGIQEVWIRKNDLTCLGNDDERAELKIVATWFAVSMCTSVFWVLVLLRSFCGNRKLCHGWLLCCLLKYTATVDDGNIFLDIYCF